MNQEDAEIVCRGLGYSSGEELEPVPAGEGPIWMDQIDCDQHHSELAECDQDGWGEHNCNHNEDFGVICSKYR